MLHKALPVLLLLTLTVSGTARAQDTLPSLDSDLQVSFSGLVFDRTSNTFDTAATIKNISTQTLFGELSFVLPTITPSSVTLANATCKTPADQPVLLASFPTTGLLPGASLPSLVLKFSDPSNVAFTYTHTILAGNECVTPEVLHAFSDSRTLPDLQTVLQTLQLFGSAFCSATLPLNPMTLDEAMSSIQQRLDENGGPGALENFIASAAQTNQELLAAEAAAAMADKNGPGALAALVAAHHNDPSNPQHLVNAAGAAGLLGLENEAIALLDAADAMGGDFGGPMGINGHALALNNRGFALLLLGQWSQAQSALNAAIAAEPFLSEARRNLGIALLCQGNAQAGAQAFRAGLLRSPRQLNLDQIFDLSQGVAPNLPPIPYPAVPALFPKYTQLWQGLVGTNSALFKSDLIQETSLQQQIDASGFFANSPLITLARVNDILHQFNNLSGRQFNSQTDPLAALYAAVQAALNTENNLTSTTSDRVVQLVDQDTPASLAQCRALIQQEHPVWLYDQGRLEAAERSFADVYYRDLTGLVSNINNPLLNQKQALEAKDALLSVDSEILNSAALYGVAVGGYWELCQGAPEDSSPAAQAANPRSSAACPDALKVAKLTLDLFGIFNVSFNCEKVEVTVAEPGLGPFAQVSVARAGDWTVFVGEKASLPGTSLGAKAGFYVSGNDSAFTDAGFKASQSGSIGPIKVDSPFGFQAGIADVVACLTGGCE